MREGHLDRNRNFSPSSLHRSPNSWIINNSKLSNGHEINGNNVDKSKLEVPLPFGYHMDLDFLRVCSSDFDTLSSETLERLKDLRKQRRKQRKTLEALMGMRKDKPVFNSNTNGQYHPRPTWTSTPKTAPDVIRTPEFLQEAIRDVVLDFEHCLERSKENSSTGGKDKFKFNTYPRMPDSSQTSEHRLLYQHDPGSNTSLNSSISTSSYLSNLPSSVQHKSQTDRFETESIASINSETSTQALKQIREQVISQVYNIKY